MSDNGNIVTKEKVEKYLDLTAEARNKATPITSSIEDERKLKFNHDNEIVEPHYYSVILDEINTKVEFTVTDRSSFFKFNFPKSGNSNIIIDAFFKNSEIKVIPNENKIIGIAKNNSGGVPENFANYFVIEFNRPFKRSGVWDGKGNIILKNQLKGKHVGAYVSFNTNPNDVIEVKVSSSFISHDQAWINLNRELPDSSTFNEIVKEGRKSWNKELSKILNQKAFLIVPNLNKNLIIILCSFSCYKLR